MGGDRILLQSAEWRWSNLGSFRASQFLCELLLTFVFRSEDSLGVRSSHGGGIKTLTWLQLASRSTSLYRELEKSISEISLKIVSGVFSTYLDGKGSKVPLIPHAGETTDFSLTVPNNRIYRGFISNFSLNFHNFPCPMMGLVLLLWYLWRFQRYPITPYRNFFNA